MEEHIKDILGAFKIAVAEQQNEEKLMRTALSESSNSSNISIATGDIENSPLSPHEKKAEI